LVFLGLSIRGSGNSPLARFYKILLIEGPCAALLRTRLYLQKHSSGVKSRFGTEDPGPRCLPDIAAPGTRPLPVNSILAPCVVIIAELSSLSCAKYRVWQRKELITLLGMRCCVINWTSMEDGLSAASFATIAILYRVPAAPSIHRIIAEFRHHGVPVFWEADDLVFNRELFMQTSYAKGLDEKSKLAHILSIKDYLAALMDCKAGIASTDQLGDSMSAAGAQSVFVIENGLDAETLDAADRIRARRAELTDSVPDEVIIVYGSGSRTHDADFLEASTAIQEVMRSIPSVKLRIVGDLLLPSGFGAFGPRVERIPPLPYRTYLEVLGGADINLAPLEDTVFNDAKSSIKFLEAAVLGIPSVCSSRASFNAAIENGHDGFLADGHNEWLSALSVLATDAPLRRRIGDAARRKAIERYGPAYIAAHQVEPLLALAPDCRKTTTLRVLIVHDTMDASAPDEATTRLYEIIGQMSLCQEVELFGFTAAHDDDPPNSMRRSIVRGVPTFRAKTAFAGQMPSFDDPSIAKFFGEALDSVEPHVVIFFSIKRLGIGVAAECLSRRLPYAIMLWDAWWLCARQRMIRADGKYCNQRRIDIYICERCAPDLAHLQLRQGLLRLALEGASLLVVPSQWHKDLFAENGIIENVVDMSPVDQGSRWPMPMAKALRSAKLLYYKDLCTKDENLLVHAALEAIGADGWELLLVEAPNTTADPSCNPDIRHVPVSRIRRAALAGPTLATLLNDVDVLILPMLADADNTMTIHHALARGIWVIALGADRPASDILDGVNGSLVRPDTDPVTLQRTIERQIQRRSGQYAVAGGSGNAPGTHVAEADWLIDKLSAVAKESFE
jgi:glycosyltransferase involved in cell wall biosynthesis